MAARIVFFGTAEIACPSLRALAADARFEIAAVVTQPDKPRGRDLQVQPSAVKAAALTLNIPVLQPARARDQAFIEQVRSIRPALGVVIAYGQILPRELLDVPTHGCLNVHTSLLPKFRGAAPIQWAILSGDSETGVTIMKMDAGLDTGPMLVSTRTPIAPDETAQTLHDRLAQIGAEGLLQAIPRYLAGDLQPVAQPEGATYARKIEKADGLIDWQEPAEVIERKIRAFTPWPGAYTTLRIGGKPRLTKIWKAEIDPAGGPAGTIFRQDRSEAVIACGARALRLLEVQPEGRKRMSIRDFLAGHAIEGVSGA